MSESTICIACPQHRDRRLKLAVVASIGSKVATAALQVLVMPLAIRTLGPEQFGIFVMLSSSLIWISTAHMGLGNSLILVISQAAAADDRAAQIRALSSAFWAVLGVCSLILLGIGVVYSQWGIGYILGQQCSAYQADINQGFWLLVGCMTIGLILDVFEGTQSGYQETHVGNLAFMLGQALSAASLALVIFSHTQSIVNLILCLYVLATVPRLFNALRLVTITRPYLLPSLWQFDRRVLVGLLATGIAFTVNGVAQFLRNQGSILLVGRLLGPVTVSTYAIIVNITLLAFGIIAMQLRPLLPALTDAWARGDHEWINRARIQILRYIMGYAVAVGGTLALLGGPIISVWYGPQVAPSVLLQVAIGLMFVLQAWETYHHTVLFGLGYIWPPVVAYIGQNLLTLVISVPLIYRFGSVGAAGAICGTALALNCWLLPLMLRRALARPAATD